MDVFEYEWNSIKLDFAIWKDIGKENTYNVMDQGSNYKRQENCTPWINV